MQRRKKYNLIREFSEFNLQRLNPDSARASIHVDDPQLSINAFDKHEDIVRNAISKLGTLSKALQNSTTYKSIKSTLGLEEQQIVSLKIIRIVKSSSLQYDVYISFSIKDDAENEYWGVVTDILNNPNFKSEIFKDNLLLQTKEWIVKTKGLVIKMIQNWLRPQFGFFKLLKDEIQCLSGLTGKLMILPRNTKIEVLKSYPDRIIFEYNGQQYTLIGDNFIYFNWWFEPVEDQSETSK
jgi:hypothetical protein